MGRRELNLADDTTKDLKKALKEFNLRTACQFQASRSPIAHSIHELSCIRLLKVKPIKPGWIENQLFLGKSRSPRQPDKREHTPS